MQALAQNSVVALVGSRQVGKTTLAKQLSAHFDQAIYLDLERPSDRAKLTDAELFLGQFKNQLVILDEIQRDPELFAILRPLVDDHRVPGRFLILGSASPELLRQSSESLAGRIHYLEMTPLLCQETGAANWEQLWLRGGYPDSFLAASDMQSVMWREQFIQTFLERDIPQLGKRIPSLTLHRLLQMMAHSQGQLWNAQKLGASLGLKGMTINSYLDLFSAAFVTRRLEPLQANLKKRLVKSPKVYLRDSGLLHALLGLETIADLYGHPVAGSSFEGFIIEQVLAVAKAKRWNSSFFRTAAGAEIDLVLEKGGHRVAIEVKLSLSPALQRGFWRGFEDLGCQRGYVIYPGSDPYPLSEQVSVIPIAGIPGIL